MKTEILDLISKGFTHREISAELGVSLGFISKIRNEGVFKPKKSKTGNVLVIGDLHAPFIRRGYLEFCVEQYNKYKCDTVVFLGDVIDNHASSYHETQPDGWGAGDELDHAITALAPFVEAFPKAMVCVGNHDRIISRKAVTSGVSSRWIKSYNEVLNAPEWEFAEHFIVDGVRYEHGEGPRAKKKMMTERTSIVCGHRHSEAYIEYSVSDKDRLFAMQVGWGGDQSAYAMEYAKNFKKGVVSCGVVLDRGVTPILIPMFIAPKQ
jgi:metallophosphoesterase superfamily enzyme